MSFNIINVIWFVLHVCIYVWKIIETQFCILIILKICLILHKEVYQISKKIYFSISSLSSLSIPSSVLCRFPFSLPPSLWLWGGVLLCSSGWPPTHSSSAIASWMMVPQVHVSMHELALIFFIYFWVWWVQGEPSIIHPGMLDMFGKWKAYIQFLLALMSPSNILYTYYLV